MKRLLRATTVLGIATGLVQPCFADPIRISYVATDLADAVPGEDRWQYLYVVSGFDFAVDQGFSISFGPGLFEDLEDPAPAVSADWDVLTVQPDEALGSSGLYDALALTAGASLADPFSVAFTWLGGPVQTPGSQFFTVNQFDAGGLLTVLETGNTVPLSQSTPVPEPSSALLVAVGAAGALRWRRHPRGARRAGR
jgi:hypothetical protein